MGKSKWRQTKRYRSDRKNFFWKNDTPDFPSSKTGFGRRKKRLPLVNKTDSKALVAFTSLFVFFLQGMTMFGVSIGTVWLVISVFKYCPDILPSFLVIGYVLIKAEIYVTLPICRAIENYFGVKGADNVDNPNTKLLKPFPSTSWFNAKKEVTK